MAGNSERTWAVEQTARTRRQLILAAMRLMARDGIDGVSLRSVNQEAGARNSSAVSYHFGNKKGLIEAIVDTLARDVALVRDPLMKEVRERQKTEDVSVREVLEAAYIPFLGLFYHPEYGLPAIRFLSRLIVDTDPEMRKVVNHFTTPLAEEVYELLKKALPEFPEHLLKSRILYSLINLINGSSDSASMAYSPFGDMSFDDPFELASDFIDYMVAGISAPPGQLTPGFRKFCDEMIEQIVGAHEKLEA